MNKMESYENASGSSADLPFGSFTNESTGGANDGTKIVAEHMQDLYYALYQVLQLAGQTPNGRLEDGNSSKQFISALGNIAPLLYNSTNIYNKGAITLFPYNSEISVYQSLVNNNSSALDNTDNWVLLAKISESGVFGNMTINSPALTGIPTAPTAETGTANSQIATTEFVKNSFKDFLKITSGRIKRNEAIYPPDGFTMSDLAAFIPSINIVHFNGDVDDNDVLRCQYSVDENCIKVDVRNSEQHGTTYANYLAIWIKL